jgi:hypothetical protein
MDTYMVCLFVVCGCTVFVNFLTLRVIWNREEDTSFFEKGLYLGPKVVVLYYLNFIFYQSITLFITLGLALSVRLLMEILEIFYT